MIREFLAYSKETENKYRWDCDCDGVKFSLYIPKWRVPEPYPRTINIKLHPLGSGIVMGRKYLKEAYEKDLALRKRPIIARLKRTSDHTKTVRFDPDYNSQWWDIGSPYIPAHILPSPDIKEIYIEVEWK